MSLITKLISEKTLKTPAIISAFKRIKRSDFMLPQNKDEAESNHPLPIGSGQTISQPYTVAFMLELLGPKKKDKVLDVGSGSGWTTALLAEIVGADGHVFAIERIPELKKFGEANVKKYVPAPNRTTEGSSGSCVQFLCSDGTKGLPEFSPFDKILISAATPKIPKDLLDQLKTGGRLTAPIGKSSQDIVVLDKISKKEYKEKRYPGFIFVPLISD
ncbi:protein-L-isoaspartate O-methyltransferase [Candidatus Falkowbacteria bacterium]|nr:protein-L-isoaspartate O-methyltransferase [Candidatus Falkowbacteria bacterium]